MSVDTKTGSEKPRTRIGRLVRFGLGTPEFELQEVWQLSQLICARLDEMDSSASDRHREWVASRFRYPLRALLIVANRDATNHMAFTLVVVAGGFATSGIAVAAGAEKGSTGSWVVFGIGLVVALAAATSQQLRFGLRSNERRSLAVALREEGWHFVNHSGDYGIADLPAFLLFEARTDDIHRRIGKVDVLDPTASDDEKGQPAKGPPQETAGGTLPA
jgi:Protein of unknown function (DUF4231)